MTQSRERLISLVDTPYYHYTLIDYFELVDSTGRIIREDKRGAISSSAANILCELGLDENTWIERVSHFEAKFGSCAGSVNSMRYFSRCSKRKWSKGVGQ